MVRSLRALSLLALVAVPSGACVVKVGPGAFDWEQILAGKTWLFVSGITPALSPGCAAEAMRSPTRLMRVLSGV